MFSILIVALTLASTQFGPRMLRNFIRDRGVQITLGTFVATFFYAVLTLGSVSHGDRGDFVPHLSITVALGLTLVDLGVLVFFIDRVARSIQLPEVIAGIARDFSAGDRDRVRQRTTSQPRARSPRPACCRPSSQSRRRRGHVDDEWLPAVRRYSTIVDIALGCRRGDRVAVPARTLRRPRTSARTGLAGSAAPDVSRGLDRAHVTGAHRTLRQDPTFAIDQLVEIAIRALSPAVNDTFTALTCIDWLSEGLCAVTARVELAAASTSTTKARCA